MREPCLILQKVHFRLSWVPQKHLCLSSLFTGFYDLAYERKPGERSYISEMTKTDRGSMEGWRKRSKCVVEGGKVLWKVCKMISRKWKLVQTPYFHVLTSCTYKSRNSHFLSLIRIVTKCSNMGQASGGKTQDVDLSSGFAVFRFHLRILFPCEHNLPYFSFDDNMVIFFILQLRTSRTDIQDRQIKKEVCSLSPTIDIENSVNQHKHNWKHGTCS